MGISPEHPAIQQALSRGLITGCAAVPKAKREKPDLVAPEHEHGSRDGVRYSRWLVPLHVVAGDNARGMRAKIGRAGHERRVTSQALSRTLRALSPFAESAQAGHRVICTLTRVGGREMDYANVVAAMKYVQDTVAMFLGVDDGPRGPVQWVYDQKPGGPVGVRIQIQAA
ncbi:hypothetical protein VT84_13920 [Gemmata sp. SH-PL17]|uniref:hypothetical protein n=1 Tax=Gemmata sp. SH-PL17 TaxID=1630693 RepID=UPI00078B3E42|nr:hypothetical protein [Gemmata sp. SH-PL17]AMV25491.1 hypothetical protein VT84_13920 [Gemmata sp. SH-PL17]